jgi:hypothetical protein
MSGGCCGTTPEFIREVSAQPPAKKTAGLSEKETNILLENGIGFHEVSYKVSGPPIAAEVASLIEKETLKKRISNNECRMSK